MKTLRIIVLLAIYIATGSLWFVEPTGVNIVSLIITVIILTLMNIVITIAINKENYEKRLSIINKEKYEKQLSDFVNSQKDLDPEFIDILNKNLAFDTLNMMELFGIDTDLKEDDKNIKKEL